MTNAIECVLMPLTALYSVLNAVLVLLCLLHLSTLKWIVRSLRGMLYLFAVQGYIYIFCKSFRVQKRAICSTLRSAKIPTTPRTHTVLSAPHMLKCHIFLSAPLFYLNIFYRKHTLFFCYISIPSNKTYLRHHF